MNWGIRCTEKGKEKEKQRRGKEGPSRRNNRRAPADGRLLPDQLCLALEKEDFEQDRHQVLEQRPLGVVQVAGLEQDRHLRRVGREGRLEEVVLEPPQGVQALDRRVPEQVENRVRDVRADELRGRLEE